MTDVKDSNKETEDEEFLVIDNSMRQDILNYSSVVKKS